MSGYKQLVSAGGDGLVKVWTIKSGECDTTLDNHTDRIWSLALTQEENFLVSGGGDSVITFWEDTTASEKEKSAKALEERVEKSYSPNCNIIDFLGNRSWLIMFNGRIGGMRLLQQCRWINLIDYLICSTKLFQILRWRGIHQLLDWRKLITLSRHYQMHN